MGTLQGILERIVYENPDTGYTVGRLSARDHTELITVVGNLASINPGESLLLQGEWVDNACLLYTSPSPRDRQKSRMPSSA